MHSQFFSAPNNNNQPKNNMCAFREALESPFYVDKSWFIKTTIKAKYLGLIFPKESGKSTNLSMLYHFYSKLVDKNPTKELFANLNIAQDDYAMSEQGKYDVLYLDFDFKPNNFAEFYALFCEKIWTLYQEHEHLAHSIHLSIEERNNFQKISTELKTKQIKTTI